MGCFNSKVGVDQKSPTITFVDKKAEASANQNVETESSKQSVKQFIDEAQLNALTFKQTVADPIGRAYYMKFLMSEHAKENLDFFQV